MIRQTLARRRDAAGSRGRLARHVISADHPRRTHAPSKPPFSLAALPIALLLALAGCSRKHPAALPAAPAPAEATIVMSGSPHPASAELYLSFEELQPVNDSPSMTPSSSTTAST